jgi:hypothetical protein
MRNKLGKKLFMKKKWVYLNRQVKSRWKKHWKRLLKKANRVTKRQKVKNKPRKPKISCRRMIPL